MKGVWSYRTNGDITKQATNWFSAKAQLYSWVLSTQFMKQYFKKTELVTDKQGYDILVNKLGLKFDNVEVILDDLNFSKDFRALGKIKAYQIQKESFMHIDFDSWFHYGIPEQLNKGGIIAQNMEDNDWFKSAYLGEIKHAEKVFSKLPKSWGLVDYAPCMGFFGSDDIEFIQEYCNEVFDFVSQPERENITNKGSYCIIFEQYLMGCVAERLNKRINYLSYPGFDKPYMESKGYIHIWGEKKSPHIEFILGEVCKKYFNNYYKKINGIHIS